PRGFAGYFWMFPRPGVLNFGVACKMGQLTSQRLRALLEDFMSGYYGGGETAPPCGGLFSPKNSIIDPESWRDLKVTGDGWALVGDAAGFVDPITGEGIYYALKSSDLLADSLDREREQMTHLPATRTEPNDGAEVRARYNRASARYEALW